MKSLNDSELTGVIPPLLPTPLVLRLPATVAPPYTPCLPPVPLSASSPPPEAMVSDPATPRPTLCQSTSELSDLTASPDAYRPGSHACSTPRAPSRRSISRAPLCVRSTPRTPSRIISTRREPSRHLSDATTDSNFSDDVRTLELLTDPRMCASPITPLTCRRLVIQYAHGHDRVVPTSCPEEIEMCIP